MRNDHTGGNNRKMKLFTFISTFILLLSACGGESNPEPNTDDFSSIYGLDLRPDNLTCVAPVQPNENSSVAVTDPFPGLPNISLPTKMILEPAADPRWFVLRWHFTLITQVLLKSSCRTQLTIAVPRCAQSFLVSF